MLKQTIYTGHLAKIHTKESPVTLLRSFTSVKDFDSIGERSWYSFNWKPTVLNESKISQALDQASGFYPFLMRESSDRFILLSTHQTVVQAFLRSCRLETVIEYPRVDIVKLVEIVSKPSDSQGRAYRLGAVFAAVEGYGQKLKTIAFWGEDIGEATLFQDMMPAVLPFRAALRDVRTDREIASIGSGGEVSFYYRGLGHLDQTDRLFRYLTNIKTISWSIPHE
jgi:hypothetical protein